MSRKGNSMHSHRSFSDRNMRLKFFQFRLRSRMYSASLSIRFEIVILKCHRLSIYLSWVGMIMNLPAKFLTTGSA